MPMNDMLGESLSHNLSYKRIMSKGFEWVKVSYRGCLTQLIWVNGE